MNGGATLAGKRALVTGGGSGVGAVIALALAEEGAAVTIAGRRRRQIEDVAARAPASITPVEADVTEEASVAAMFEAAGAPVHIVVANAGAAESAPFAKTDAALWARMLAVNLTGTFLTFREALRRMKGSDWGRLIAVASTAGLKGYPYVAPYCAAKHGVVGLTRALALETARMGVTVNALCPGFMETPLLVRSVANITAKTGKSEEEARLVLAGTNPMGRFVRPDEVACAVLWLCGPGADAVTGQAISISGGETS